jgi:hypothetical protein
MPSPHVPRLARPSRRLVNRFARLNLAQRSASTTATNRNTQGTAKTSKPAKTRKTTAISSPPLIG